jgi:pimeloyl-ACP methyl ester carboxylesterase
MNGWPGFHVATPRGPLFIRHAPSPAPPRVAVDHVNVIQPHEDRLTTVSSGGFACPRPSDLADARPEPVLFVHGLGGESLDWADVATLLAGRVDAYALDLPGFGQSPPPSDHDLSIDAHVRAVAAAIGAIGRGPVHLVGNSLGGAVATRVAAERPDLVASLVLLSPAFPDRRPRVATVQLLITMIPVIGPRLVARALRDDPVSVARRVFATCYGNPEMLSDRRWAEEVASIRRRAQLPHSPPVYHGSLRSLIAAYLMPGRRGLWQQAQLVGVRTLLIYGGRDKLVNWRMGAKAGAAFPDARLVLMLDAGHVAHLEFPDRVANVMRAFYDELPVLPLTPGMGQWHGTVRGSAGTAVAAGPVGRRPP